MKKRIMALGLALSMLVASNAFAEDTTADLSATTLTGDLAVTSTVTVPTATVTVPTSGAIIINPYGLKSGDDDATDEIVSPNYDITAGSTNNVKVSVYMTAATVKTVKPSTAVPVATKEAYDTAITKNTKNVLLGIQSKTEAGSYQTIQDGFTASDLTVLGTGYKAPKETPDGVALATDLGAGDKANFKFVGLANKDVASPWTADDTVSVTLSYKLVMGDAIVADED